MEGKKKTRDLIRPEELNTYFGMLERHVNKYFTVTKAIKGPTKGNSDEVSMLKESIEFSDVLESTDQSSKAEKEDIENEEKKFFAILEQMSSASAIPKSFVDSCKAHGIDFTDPNNIVIEGTNLRPYSHQVINMAWLAGMGKSAFRGGILASESGSGKTVVMFLLILMVYRKLTTQGSKEHGATLIIVPSAVVEVWYADFVKFFSGALICRIFHGIPGSNDPNWDKCFVGIRIKDSEKELQALDITNLDTSRTFFLTS
ncbi:hypothetical protein ACHAPC_011007 [Botrytis cinerea]